MLVSCIVSSIGVFIYLGKDSVEKVFVKNTYIDSDFSRLVKIVKGNNNDIRVEEKELFKLYIPKINLLRNVYDVNSSLNDVSINVELLNSSDKGKNLYLLASHSGGGQASYFDNLIYLEKGDIIFLKYRDKSLSYVVDKIFYIEKNGYFETTSRRDTLFLITCSLSNQKEQLVVVAKIVK